MSGGFFRGTSADQDTRFSNKQAKLLKSQKFAPELEHLVDMTKVKMDVIRPWIATRVTELLGFEDEVLINFIYGLLDRKLVNGKEVQIQLTGFMEKNTGKFMKELWMLLISAQNNASGVPQQFLDAKAEETRNKKEEADRITHEIQKKKEKEGRELEQEKMKKMDGEVDDSRDADAASHPISKRSLPRASSAHPEDEKEAYDRNGSRGKNRVSKSPHSADRSPSSHRSTPSGSINKSLSNSRSYSECFIDVRYTYFSERHKSRSVSGSPQPRGRSISPGRRYRSPRTRSISPRRRYSPWRARSPLRRRSPHSRRRSSRSLRRSPSPVRRRFPSPLRRRSPSPVRRRSPSPVRRRSRSPMRRRSPRLMRQRSPSPPRHRSPLVRRRSPIGRKRSPTPSRRRSPSPLRRGSPSLSRRRSPSPLRRKSPIHKSPRQRRRSPVRSPRQRIRSPSPCRSRSPAYRGRRSLSRDHDIRANGVESRRYRDGYAPQRISRKLSPVRHASEGEEIENHGQIHKGPDSVSHRPPISLRSPQRDPRDSSNARKKVHALSPSPENSRSPSPRTRKMRPSEDRRMPRPYESPVRQIREQMAHGDSPSPPRQPRERITRYDSPETSGEKEISHARHSPIIRIQKNSTAKDFRQEESSPERLDGPQYTEAQSHPDDRELRKKDQDRKSEKVSKRTVHPETPTKQTSPILEEIRRVPQRLKGESFSLDRVRDEPAAKKRDRDSPSSSERLPRSSSRKGYKADEKKHSHSSNVEGSDRHRKTESLQKSLKHADRNNQSASSDSGSEESYKYRPQDMKKKKHKRSGRHEMASDDGSYDSQIDDRKEAKRRRKEEKRLRKEEKRLRREERHRRREERHAGKLKMRSMDTVTPLLDCEKHRKDAYDSGGDLISRRESRPSDAEETEPEQKKLEIELRQKALESLRAKKGISH
ncbi:hypothetical protein HHK36_011056 [Tetracentron sinense]|uniref:PWI domain-containing protein n=1 Tax=Tetracentron sinense TaxID=13715 RepID=A0A835DFV9_TETSI|nr:hypothetical protein HHK36_011056 [Tetracentron sinense]